MGDGGQGRTNRRCRQFQAPASTATGPGDAGGATAGLVLLVLALTLDDLVPRELRTSSQTIMSLMTIDVLALWLLLVEQLRRRL